MSFKDKVNKLMGRNKTEPVIKANSPLKGKQVQDLEPKLTTITMKDGKPVRVIGNAHTTEHPNRAQRREVKKPLQGVSRNRKNTPGRITQHEEIMLKTDTKYGKVSTGKTGYGKKINHKVVQAKIMKAEFSKMNSIHYGKQSKEVKDEVTAANRQAAAKVSKSKKAATKSARKKG